MATPSWELTTALVLIKTAESGLTFTLNTFVILSVLTNKALRQNPTFILITALFCMDTLPPLIILTFDVPSTIIGDELYGPPFTGILVAIQSICWFTPLFLLPIVASVHLSAVIFPLQFRSFRSGHSLAILFTVFTISSALTIPLYLKCCGYKYYTEGNYWSLDYAKPYTQLYMTFNTILQVVCIGLMILIDLAIILLVYRNRFLKSHRTLFVAPAYGGDHERVVTTINSSHFPRPHHDHRLSASHASNMKVIYQSSLISNLDKDPLI